MKKPVIIPLTLVILLCLTTPAYADDKFFSPTVSLNLAGLSDQTGIDLGTDVITYGFTVGYPDPVRSQANLTGEYGVN